MGLDTSHNCWHGSYGRFMSWRRKICEVSGYGLLDDYRQFGGDAMFPDNDALVILLTHSDCDGEIEWEDCNDIAKRLEELLPALRTADNVRGEYSDLESNASTFIDGLKTAFVKQENVDFH